MNALSWKDTDVRVGKIGHVLAYNVPVARPDRGDLAFANGGFDRHATGKAQTS
jgi:hypothetical protein